MTSKESSVPILALRRTALRPRRGPLGGHAPVLQVSPVPHGRDEVLAVAIHFASRFASTTGKPAPAFSEDAADFLSSRRWNLSDLTFRVCRAVEQNRGNLITADDLS